MYKIFRKIRPTKFQQILGPLNIGGKIKTGSGGVRSAWAAGDTNGFSYTASRSFVMLTFTSFRFCDTTTHAQMLKWRKKMRHVYSNLLLSSAFLHCVISFSTARLHPFPWPPYASRSLSPFVWSSFVVRYLFQYFESFPCTGNLCRKLVFESCDC